MEEHELKMKSENDDRRLYGDLAWLWPIISPPEEYVEETELFSKTIKTYSKNEARTLLHLGCGGGHNDYTFKRYFKVTGIDLSQEMLKLARKLNPEVTYHIGDMRTISLKEYFDAVTILDSINYMTTLEDLRSAFITAYEHLKSGGVFLTVVEKVIGKLKQNNIECSSHSQGEINIVFIENSYDPDPTDTSYETTFLYLIRYKGKLEIHTDRHLCGIFKIETWHDLLKEVGFEVKQMRFEHSSFAEEECFPMLVCTKPL